VIPRDVTYITGVSNVRHRHERHECLTSDILAQGTGTHGRRTLANTLGKFSDKKWRLHDSFFKQRDTANLL
jgi:hypothetical protein